jgi:hypothetical protein
MTTYEVSLEAPNSKMGTSFLVDATSPEAAKTAALAEFDREGWVAVDAEPV